MNDVRIGLIGAGGMGTFHARTLAAMPGVSVTVIADPVGDAAETLAGELDAVGMKDPEMLATAGGVDGLVIASPDETHAELAMAAMELGTPVLCEKPLATTTEDCQRIVDLEVAHGTRLLQLGFMREYDLAHRQVLESLDELGRIHSIRCVHVNTHAQDRTPLAIVNQSMVHDLHTVRYMTGEEIVSVTGHATKRPTGAMRHVVLLCVLSSGAHATVEFDDNGFAYDTSIELVAEAGSVLSGPEVRAIRHQDGKSAIDVGRDWFGRFADAYRIQDEAWVASLRSGETTGPSAWDGLAAGAVAAAALESLDSGGPVPVSLPAKPDLY